MESAARLRAQAMARARVAENPRASGNDLIKELNKLWDTDEDELVMSINDVLLELGAERIVALARIEARERKPRRAETSPHKEEESRDMLTKADGHVYSWALPNGATLAYASIVDIDDAIAKHRLRAEAHIGWVKFYSAVKAKMLKAKVNLVQDLFLEPELLQLTAVSGVGPATRPAANPFGAIAESEPPLPTRKET